MTPPGHLISVKDPLNQILVFILCHKDRIIQEIEAIEDVGDVRKWVLELSTTYLPASLTGGQVTAR